MTPEQYRALMETASLATSLWLGLLLGFVGAAILAAL